MGAQHRTWANFRASVSSFVLQVMNGLTVVEIRGPGGPQWTKRVCYDLFSRKMLDQGKLNIERKIKISNEITQSCGHTWTQLDMFWKAVVQLLFNTVECRNPNAFGFRTDDFGLVAIFFRTNKTPKSERFCSDFRRSVD